MANLDKFYTKQEVVIECYQQLISLLPVEEELFLEPSAGNGAFLTVLKNFVAYDIQPEHERIIKQDFLLFNSDYKHYITIGNPPFGRRSKLAIDFFNKAAEYSDVIAFILPVSFMKWGVQKQLDPNFQLISFKYLPLQSFLDGNKEFGVRTVFQIWVKAKSKFATNQINLRLLKSPPISHPDFLIWQHNATVGSRKYVDEDWEIATWRQGYKNYNDVFSRNDYEKLKDMVYNTNLQFFFIKPLTEDARSIIALMDFNALAERNTSTPGFGKGDFVSYYLELKANHS